MKKMASLIIHISLQLTGTFGSAVLLLAQNLGSIMSHWVYIILTQEVCRQTQRMTPGKEKKKEKFSNTTRSYTKKGRGNLFEENHLIFGMGYRPKIP